MATSLTHVWTHPDGYRAEGTEQDNVIRFTVNRLSWSPERRVTWWADSPEGVEQYLIEWFGEGWKRRR